MSKTFWVGVDRWVRWLHLYSGLFLTPWMLTYGASAFCLNHNQWFIQRLGVEPVQWRRVDQQAFPVRDDIPREPAEQARAILQYLGLDGPHRVLGRPNAMQLTVLRISGAGNYRVTWLKRQGRLVVERQAPFSWYRLIHHLHFRAGYAQPYASTRAWAVLVDAVAVAIAFWCLSGFYLWLRLFRRRLLGAVLTIGGLALFAGLVVSLCR